MRTKPVWQCAHGDCKAKVPFGRNFCEEHEVDALTSLDRFAERRGLHGYPGEK